MKLFELRQFVPTLPPEWRWRLNAFGYCALTVIILLACSTSAPFPTHESAPTVTSFENTDCPDWSSEDQGECQIETSTLTLEPKGETAASALEGVGKGSVQIEPGDWLCVTHDGAATYEVLLASGQKYEGTELQIYKTTDCQTVFKLSDQVQQPLEIVYLNSDKKNQVIIVIDRINAASSQQHK